MLIGIQTPIQGRMNQPGELTSNTNFCCVHIAHTKVNKCSTFFLSSFSDNATSLQSRPTISSFHFLSACGNGTDRGYSGSASRGQNLPDSIINRAVGSHEEVMKLSVVSSEYVAWIFYFLYISMHV